MANFSWKYKTPNKGWWANYRWHITEQSEKMGLKANGWKKSFFRSGWQNRMLEVENVEGAKKCLQGLQNGTITAFGGRFRGASYDKNAERIIKQVKRSLKEEIRKYDKGESIEVDKNAIVPDSYYNWVLVSISGGAVVVILGLIFVIWWKKTEKR